MKISGDIVPDAENPFDSGYASDCGGCTSAYDACIGICCCCIWQRWREAAAATARHPADAGSKAAPDGASAAAPPL